MNPAHTSTNPASGLKARYAQIPPRTAILKERAKSGDITQPPFDCVNQPVVLVARRLQRQLLHAVPRLCPVVPLSRDPPSRRPGYNEAGGTVTSRRGPACASESSCIAAHKPAPATALQPSLHPVGNFLRINHRIQPFDSSAHKWLNLNGYSSAACGLRPQPPPFRVAPAAQS